MSIFTKLVIHTLTILAILGMFTFIFIFIIKANDGLQRMMRTFAFSAGVLIFLGAKAFGVSIPSLILSSMDSTGMLSGSALTIGPAAAGSIVTFYLFKSINNDDPKGHRYMYLLLLIATLTVLIFSDIYFGVVLDNESQQIIAMNVSFLVGILLTLLFRVDIAQNLYYYLNGKNQLGVSSPNHSEGTQTWKQRHDKVKK